MAWLQIHVTTGRDGAPLIERLLEEIGALSITLEDGADEPLLEPGPGETPVWSETVVTGLFEVDKDPDALYRAILTAIGETKLRGLETEILEDRVWERAWMEDFHPMCFGGRLWVCPTGQPAPDPGAVTMELDPGLAFGTGTHPTTRLCLGWLAELSLPGKHLVDLGCGSGILAIAALRLGARHATAIDHDPQALQATRDNAEKNGVLGRLTIRREGGEEVEPADVLVANILASSLIDLETLIARYVQRGGLVALSGILEAQGDAVQEAFSSHFEMEEPRQDGEWLLLTGRRR